MSSDDLFPDASRAYIEAFQFSSWYPAFSSVSPKATVIRPLSQEFRRYLEDDGVFVPEGADDYPQESTLSDSDSDSEAGDAEPGKSYSFPELDAQIRDVISQYGAVFPKLNWTSPRDASWVVPTLKCKSPADVYLLLKSSDFISHDIDSSLAFEGCVDDEANGQDNGPQNERPPHDLELVLKKWYSMDPSREFRCFVRDKRLLAIVQRDINYYPHLNETDTQEKIKRAAIEFWEQKVRGKFPGGGNYVFDIHMTRDLSSAYILDFNPFHPMTDSLLVTYEELLDLYNSEGLQPHLHTVSSPSHPAAARNAPANQHNAIPYDALQLSSGVDIDSFARQWEEQLKTSQQESDEE
ncbi:hypothetical protein M422DRAFT_234819 [Sphaerobolus stellatus SS14]|uniref:Uncharacterized protein n=1 Tax=Sphaerobolus stellatus (strain SS14) TaxID=990650 RepID=A0A0C9UNM2_SPHS4|nr:hypothetical protein M422DRAFT_234819 [Sphaerobolus stellatus SS14]